MFEELVVVVGCPGLLLAFGYNITNNTTAAVACHSPE